MIRKIVLTLLIMIYSFALIAKERIVELAWDPITGAVSYEIEVNKVIDDDQFNVISTDSTYSLSWRKKLPPGEYAYRIRSLDYRKVAGPWSEYQKFYVNLPSVSLIRPYDNELIEGITSKRVDILFAWKEVIGARYYLLHILNSKNQTIYKKVVSDTKNFVNLGTGEVYLWRVEALKSKDDPIPPPNNMRLLDIKGAPVLPVEIELIARSSFLGFRWTKSPGAQFYAYHLYQKQSGSWVKLTSKEEYKRNVWKIRTKNLSNDYYRFVVEAKSPGRSASKRSAIEFYWSGSKTSEVVKKLEEPITASTTNQIVKTVRSPYEAYATFSSLSGEYDGYDDTYQVNIKQNLSAQRFRLGLKYNTPNKNYIWQGSIGMDNFVDSTEALKLLHFDADFRMYWGTKYRLDVGLGLFAQQSPLIEYSLDSGTEHINLLSAGLTAIAVFKYQFAKAWFLEMGYHLQTHLIGLSLPEGSLNPSMENIITFRVIYRFGELIDFVLGMEMNSANITFTGTQTTNPNSTTVNVSGLNAGVTIPF